METDHPRLRQPPLRSVICQLRFPTRVGFGDEEGRALQLALESTFPLLEKQLQQIVQISADGVQQVQASEPIFRLQTEDKTWTVTVASSAVSIETTNYVRFSDFLDRWTAVYKAVLGALGLQRQIRLGLRYQNQIDLPEMSYATLKKIISGPMLGPIGRHKLTKQPIASFQEVGFVVDGEHCTLRHGAQQVIDGHFAYVVDLDVYDEKTRRLDLESHFDQLMRFNEIAWDIFKWSVTPEQFQLFAPDGGSKDDASS
jgi:uncharacterized protein (TIGR04255 family)